MRIRLFQPDDLTVTGREADSAFAALNAEVRTLTQTPRKIVQRLEIDGPDLLSTLKGRALDFAGGKVDSWTGKVGSRRAFEMDDIDLTVRQFVRAAESASRNEPLLEALLGGADRVIGSDRGDILAGFAGADVVDGRRGNDVVLGGDGDDRLKGGRGNDDVEGGFGDDLIGGGRGRDALRGGGGSDEFRFNRGDGVDVIDLPRGVDFEDVRIRASGDDAVVIYGDGDRVVLEGVKARFLDESDFV